MVKAYVILAHNHPAQLQRLIKALNDGRSVFFVHIDKSADIASFDSFNFLGDKIQFLTREKTSWAGYGLVQAILHGLRAVRASQHCFSHVILLSGQDYPIKSNAFINRFAEEHAGKIFLEYHRLPNENKWVPDGGLYRVNKYFMGLKSWQLLSSKALNFLSRYVFFLRRRPYGGMQPFAGSMWWIMNMAAVQYILDFVKAHPGYAAFHQYTFAADEVFFHNILLNAKDKILSESIVNTDKRFIKWKSISSPHPEVIGKENIPEMIDSDALFARKFDGHGDTEILDIIDSYRLSTD